MFESSIAASRRPSTANSGTPGDAPDDASERAGESLLRWLAATLDEVDYGVLLVAEGGDVVHVNRAASSELDAMHPLQLFGRQLRARYPKDAATLQEALGNAARRGLRKLLTLGVDTGAVTVSIVPLPAVAAGEGPATLVMLGKRQVCGELSVEGYARTHGLTPAETRVLLTLCQEKGPSEAAAHLGVAISTVRTQIGMIRMKTGAPSIRELLRQVATLPPMMNVLRMGAGVDRRTERELQHA